MRRFRAVWVIVILFLLFTGIPGAVGYITDWLWFREVGFQSVFSTELIAKIGLFVLTAIIAYFFITLNGGYAAGGVSKAPVLWRVSPELPPVDIAHNVGKIVKPVGIVLALFFGVAAGSSWMELLQMVNHTAFHAVDPVFGRDIGWYVFVLPALSTLIGMARGLVIITLVLSLFMHLLRGRVTFPPQRVGLQSPADHHIAALLVAFLLLTAVQIWMVRIPELLFSTTGPLVGASYTDLHANYPALHIIAFTALIGAVLVIYGMLRQKIVWFTFMSFIAYIVVSVVVGGLFPWGMQRFIVAPTELTREAPQLKSHIMATRAAWGIDKVEMRDLTGDAKLTLDDIRANSSTVQNVRLWDRDALLQTFGQLQEIRTYYDFISIDDDRYVINGRYRQVLLSPRELNSAKLPTPTFINQHLTFTHGMGLTVGPVNEVTSEGLPVLFVKDLPPASNVSLKVTRPQIYFGELTDEYAVVNTHQPEFDYPSGEQNVTAHYNGTGGVHVGSFLRRAMFAIRFGALNILLSGDITSDSRVLYNRKIYERVKLALPFLSFDGDPYLIITDNGELKWMLDGYTKTDRYPYSQRLTDGTSYMRNSVKVIIDAYNGSIDAYVVDPTDPLAATYGRIFPGIFKPIAAMPADIRKHMRYPTDLFSIQSSLFATYHMDAAESFYHREDQWQAPALVDQPDEGQKFMRHIVMKLPEEKQAEYIFMSPFTPKGKDNLAAWMIARNDGPEYGKLSVYRFPKQSLVYGPQQIKSRINQDTDISRELTLWDQRGSEVIRGELLVIPIEEALIYVQPIYLRSQGGKIPELKRVVVAYQNQVVMAETLELGLARLFGGNVPQTSDSVSTSAGLPGDTTKGVTTAVPSPAVSVTEAQQHYDRAIQAQRSGDWAAYGREIKALGEVLARLRNHR